MRHVWRVRETDLLKHVVQDRYLPADSRKEAKEKYDKKYRKYSYTKLTAIIVGEMSEWEGEDE